MAYEGFVVPEGIPILEGTPFTQPLFVGIPSVEASSSQPVLKEEEEEKEGKEEEKPKGICRFVRLLRQIRGVQPTSIPREYIS